MQLIKTPNSDLRVTAKFATENKHDSYCDYLYLVNQNKYYSHIVEIQRIFNFTATEFIDFKDSLLSNYTFLGEDTGGAFQDKQINQDIVNGILIFNQDTHNAFVINNEGYSYARYVGVLDNSTSKQLYKKLVTPESIVTYKGIYCDVLTNEGSKEDCTNFGISSKHSRLLLTGNKIPEVAEETDISKVVNLYYNPQLKVKPVKTKYHSMMGGNFIYSSDSRFRQISNQPIPIHDRVEF